MKKLAIYGKGGSGKSTIASALAVCFARRGRRVLLVGCDPKADSTFVLTDGKRAPTILDLLGSGNRRPAPEEFVAGGRFGIDCVEAGGPEPGAGCGGRAIARMFEYFAELGFPAEAAYDLVIFDVLGDVVCGGFAAPLRHGSADLAYVVVSAEPLTLYAANNIGLAVGTYAVNGVRLGGLIANACGTELPAQVVRFARHTGVPVIGSVPRDPSIPEAEARFRSAAELGAGHPVVTRVEALADGIIEGLEGGGVIPKHLIPEHLFAVLRGEELPGQEMPAGESRSPPAGKGDGDGPRPASAPRSPGVAEALGVDSPLLGGKEAGDGVARLLGYRRERAAQLRLSVDEFSWSGKHFDLVVRGPSIGRLSMTLVPAEIEQCFARAGPWSVSYQPPVSPPGRKVLDYTVKRLARPQCAPGVLAALLLSDPARPEEVLAQRQDRGQRPVDREARHWCEWGESSTKGVFIYPGERGRQVRGQLRLAGLRTLNIHHASDVCQFSKQKDAPWATHFVRFPWTNERIEDTYGDRADWLTTGLSEYQVIAGSNRALEEALELARRADQSWDAVSVYVSCTPVVAGEDWAGTIRRFAEDVDLPVMMSGIGDGDISIDIQAVARSVLGDELKVGGEHSAAGVHLVGFPPTRASRELGELLAICGLLPLQRQVPAVSIEGLKSYGEAAAQLLWPQEEFEGIYRCVFEKLDVPAFRITAPFGLQRSRIFVEEAAVSVGLESGVALAAAEPLLAEAARKVEELAVRTSGHRLGIALASSQAGLLGAPERFCGVSLVDFLEELGFGVEVLMDSEQGSRLDWWIGTGLSAVFTDLACDRRLGAAGVAQFGLSDLESGPAGAVRTARRLLRLCESPILRGRSRLISSSRGSQ